MARTIIASNRSPAAEFRYRHKWRVGDLVMWDNRTTLHRVRPFDDEKYPRDLRRTTLTCGKLAAMAWYAGDAVIE